MPFFAFLQQYTSMLHYVLSSLDITTLMLISNKVVNPLVNLLLYITHNTIISYHFGLSNKKTEKI